MAATTVSRSNIGTNDDGSGTTGTVINTAYIGLIYDNIDAIFSSTTGITLNQAGGDGAILTLESSDVAHGMTTYIPTSAYGAFSKMNATDGGLNIFAATEATTALQMLALSTVDTTTKSTAAGAPVEFFVGVKSGTSVTSVGSNANMVVIRNAGITRFIFDGDGDAHADVSWTTYDTHDDVALLTSMEGELAGRDSLRAGFHEWMTYNRDALTKAKLVSFNDDGHHFVNFSRLSMALCGAIRQLAERCERQEVRLRAIEGR